MQENILNLVSHPLFLLSLGVIFALIANYLRDRRLEREEASLRDEALRNEEALQALGSAPLSSTNRTNLADR